jgi:hypothetical protein
VFEAVVTALAAQQAEEAAEAVERTAQVPPAQEGAAAGGEDGDT